MLHVLLQVSNWCAHLNLVLPFVLCPFLLEFKFSALCRLESIDKVNLNFVDIDHEGDISTGRIESQVSIDCTVVSRTDFKRTLDCVSLLSLESHSDRLLYYL